MTDIYCECTHNCTDCFSNSSNPKAYTREQERYFGENRCMILSYISRKEKKCKWYLTMEQYVQKQTDAKKARLKLKERYQNGYSVYSKNGKFGAAKCQECKTWYHDPEIIKWMCPVCATKRKRGEKV